MGRKPGTGYKVIEVESHTPAGCGSFDN